MQVIGQPLRLLLFVAPAPLQISVMSVRLASGAVTNTQSHHRLAVLDGRPLPRGTRQQKMAHPAMEGINIAR